MKEQFTKDQKQPDLLSKISNGIKTENQSKIEKTLTVVKRNGKIVPFTRTRIAKAIEAAFRDTKSVQTESLLSEELKQSIEELTLKVTEQVLNLGQKGVSITVEGIQDIVEVTLMKNGHHDVARDYIIYRDKHKVAREESLTHLKLYRHDGSTLVRFNPIKIASTLEKVFRITKEIHEEYMPSEIIQTVNELTEKVVEGVALFKQKEETIHVSQIQDLIEQTLMNNGFFQEAKEYILFRASKGQQLTIESKRKLKANKKRFSVTTADGTKRYISEEEIHKRIQYACRDLSDVSTKEIFDAAILNFYEGIKEKEIDTACIMASRAKVEKDPAYSKVTARLLLDVIYRETMETSSLDSSLKEAHQEYFKRYIPKGINYQRLTPRLLEYDLDKLSKALDISRDDQFTYLGLQTLYDRYFIHHQERRLETPQIFFMRVAMGLALNEEEKNEKAIEFYQVLSSFYFMSSTPTLFNAGTNHSQLSSCYLSTVNDDLSHIFKVIADDAQLSKWAGGLGNDWTSVRATGSVIKGTNGKSQGVIPFLKVANDTAVAVNQCFAPHTLVYTGKGILPIEEIKKGDLVLGIQGSYREVKEHFSYLQKDAMVSIAIQHALSPMLVTTGHPFYGIRAGKSMKDGSYKKEWIEAKDLQCGDYIAQVIPSEIVTAPGIDEEDMRLYGILLGNRSFKRTKNQWTLVVHPQKDGYFHFITEYLSSRKVPFSTKQQKDSQIKISSSYALSILDDLFDSQTKKHIAPRLSHMPRPMVLALVQGLIEAIGTLYDEKEIIVEHPSKALMQGLRYQLLRLGILVEGNETQVHIPMVEELAERFGCTPAKDCSYLSIDDQLFSKVLKIEHTPTNPIVCDLKVEGDHSYMTTAGLAHNGGKRKGALCSYLETWHLDIEDFLELRKNTGDERRRTHDMNTANWIPDLFMKRVEQNGHWTLFSPSDTPDLHDLYGQAFEKRYQEYEKMAEEGQIKLHKKVEALTLWRKMLSMLFETGHPWITFKDPSNIRSPQDHVGVVHSSNLCTEILLNTSKEEIAVCNLGSVNLVKHMTDKGLDEKRLAKTVETAIRMLDNVIDINFYPVAEAENANKKHRPIGLGLMGFQDALYMMNIPYASYEAIEFADKSMEMISYYAILSSSKLAKERGTYSSYKGSKWDRGYLPIDTLDLLEKERGQEIEIDKKKTMDWDKVREHVKHNGMRNSNCMAIAPTATIANIVGVSASIEPTYKNLYVKSNLSGEFTVPNSYLVQKLKERNLWNDDMLDDLKYYDGSILEIETIPNDLKTLFLTCFEIEPEWVIACGSRRQKWIDMGQSLNLYISEPNGKKLHEMYTQAWKQGLKTTYYLRSLGATQIEKSTTDINKRGLQPRWMKSKSASSNIQVNRKKPIVCAIEDEGCESCQ